jgi:hypothetical protein
MKYPWISFILVFGLAVLGNLAADKIIHLFKDSWWDRLPLLSLFICFITFLGISFYLYISAARFFFARNLFRHEAKGKKSLIILVSVQSRALVTDSTNFTIERRLKGKVDNVDVEVTLAGNPREDIAALDAFKNPSWNWKQLIRAIEPHIGSVQRVYLVGSRNSDGTGSYTQLENCSRLLKFYLENTDVLPVTAAVDFEDFNAVVELLRNVIAGEKKRGTKEGDIAIDVTGGQKTASIAGASITFNSDVVFQYVQTTGDQPKVYLYDLVYRIPLSQ